MILSPTSFVYRRIQESSHHLAIVACEGLKELLVYNCWHQLVRILILLIILPISSNSALALLLTLYFFLQLLLLLNFVFDFDFLHDFSHHRDLRGLEDRLLQGGFLRIYHTFLGEGIRRARLLNVFNSVLGKGNRFILVELLRMYLVLLEFLAHLPVPYLAL